MATNISGGKIVMVGVALGLASTVLLYLYLRRQTQLSQSYKANWKMVVVARTELPAFTNITMDSVVLVAVPPEFISPDAIQDPKTIKGKLVRHGIHANTQITMADLMVANEIPGLAIRVPAGKRAIAIAASEVIAVGTMIKPGDHVDILATYRNPDNRIETTQMILQNVPVLAVNIGQTNPETHEGAKTSMTLAVAPEDTERLTAAASAGQLRVSLRSPTDNAVIRTPGVTVKDIPFGRMQEEDTPTVFPVMAPPVQLAVNMEQTREIAIVRGTETRRIVP